jgi:hypothetical protein
MSEVSAKVLKNAAVQYLRSQGLLPSSRKSEAMARRWAMDEHRAKITASVERRLADPAALAAMRERMDRNRVPRDQIGGLISEALWRKHGWGDFASNDDLTKWIVAEYERGTTARQISLAVAMSHNSVCDRLRSAGIELPVRGAGRRRGLTKRLQRIGIDDLPAFDAVVATLYAEGRSVHSIAGAYGMNDDPIRTSLYRSGVVLRGKGGRQSKIPPWGYKRQTRENAHG